METIEEQLVRVEALQKVKIALDQLVNHFTNGDFYVKQVNSVLDEIKESIDNPDIITPFQKEDFNYILGLRNAYLAPIMQNASFAKEYVVYDIEVIAPVEN